MIVVDTSVVVAALLGHDPARHALDDRRLVAPHLIDAEVAHALRGLVLGGRVTADDGERLLSVWQRLAIDRLPMTGLLPRAWALRDALTAYDAMFVTAAEALRVPLVTCDRQLAHAGAARCTVEIVPGASSMPS